ncbi:MAG: plasmid replication initiator TrfA [Gallionellaceae bacterium]
MACFEIPASIQAELDAIDANKKAEDAEGVSVELVGAQLAAFPKGRHVMPNGWARSPLFSIVGRGRRRYLKGEKIAAWEGWEITFRGEQLDQSDLDVLLAAVILVSQSNDGEARTSHRALLKAAGKKGAGSKDIVWLKTSLSRMTATDLSLSHNGKAYHGNILNWADENGEVLIWLNNAQSWLWKDTTWLSIEQRRALRLDLSKWLQVYVCSHKATKRRPHFIKLDRLQELCGSEIARSRRFREQVANAMAELDQEGIIAQWTITENNVLKFAR